MSGDSGLMIGGVQDPAEKAADRIADRVMRMPASPSVVHRKCAECEGEDKKVQRAPEEPDSEEKVQTKPAPKSTPIAPGAIAAAASPGAARAVRSMGAGKPLPSAERAFFEPRFDADLSFVRIHDGPTADNASRAVGARAFALGNDVAFAKGEHQPGTDTGRRLMAHELAHVGQQSTHGVISLQREDNPEESDKCESKKKEKMKEFKVKYPFKTWGVGILTQNNATNFVKALPEKEGGVQIFKGSRTKYATIVNEINIKKGLLHPNQCMAYPIGWVDPKIGSAKKEDASPDKKDLKCKEDRKEKWKKFKVKYPFKTWGFGILTQKDATKFVEALPEKEGGIQIFKGSKDKFATVINEINKKKGFLQPNQCIAYPIGWVDPNIGSIMKEITSLNKKDAIARKNDVIATIYAEQSHFNNKVPDINKLFDKQRKYIYYAMLLRIESPEFAAELKDIVTGKAFHGKKPVTKSGAYKNNYLPAIEYLEKGSTKKPINKAIVEKVKTLVGDKTVKPPADAGPFYFHWEPTETITAESEFKKVKNQEIENGAQEAAASMKAEKSGAFKQAKEKLGATMRGVTIDTGWLTKIAGRNSGKGNERIGSMYIYK